MKTTVKVTKRQLDFDLNANKERFISMFREIVKREGAEDLLKWLMKSDFFTAPASTQYHMNVKGGLCQHTLNVIDNLFDSLSDALVSEEERESAFIVAALHDICKVNFYKLDSRNVKVNGEWIPIPYFRVDEELPFGHGEKSVYIAQSFMNLTREEALAIRWHMGDFSEAYGACGRAFAMCPLAVYLHLADVKATYMDEATFDYIENEWKEA